MSAADDASGLLSVIHANPESGYEGDYPLCPSWFYTVIRHVQRNMDIECQVHDQDDPAQARICGSPGRWDGDTIAHLINLVPDLVLQVRTLEDEVERLRST